MKTQLSTLLLMAALLNSSEMPAPAQPAPGASLGFVAAEGSEFTFDTGVLRGKLRAGGKSTGLTSVIHLPSGTRVDSSMGLFGHYRVFTANHRYGAGAWDWPSEGRIRADGSVETVWPAAEGRPFELRAVYRWAAPDTLDLLTSVTAKADLVKFESFLASYFTESFTNSLVCAGASSKNQAASSSFMIASREAGIWLAFPRDTAAVAILQDGRWKLEPHPVDWVIQPRLTYPLGLRRAPAPGLTGLLMAPPKDCFAVLTPYETEPHYSTYLSLFGSDIAAGATVRARSRLILRPRLSEAEAVALYQKYVQSAAGSETTNEHQ